MERDPARALIDGASRAWLFVRAIPDIAAPLPGADQAWRLAGTVHPVPPLPT
jgi:hypothetical protein